MDKYTAAADFIMSKTKHRPKCAVILGSGLGDFADRLENADIISYKDIPNFPVSTVSGHKGRFVISEKVMCMQGRIHYYEGYDMSDVTFAVRVMKLLGIETLIATNAAGGVNTAFEAGDLMLITDHINFMGTNPLIGANDDSFGPRFPDMSQCYSRALIEKAEKTAEEKNITLKKGVYFAMTGPSYETPAEVRMIRILGGDAVGMSTVPEVITAAHCGINVLGISCITNMAAGVTDKPLSHSEVMETGIMVKEKFICLLEGILEKI